LTKAVRDAYIKKPLIIYEIKWKWLKEMERNPVLMDVEN
jgi:hypothetical protein